MFNPHLHCHAALDPRVIAENFASDGQQVPTEGQVASLTSTNNFINFCLTVNKPITNGQQITGGSCNPAPIGVVASTANMPSSKFVNPKNGDTIQANQAFTIQMAVRKLVTGNFVNAQTNYFAAPQQYVTWTFLCFWRDIVRRLGGGARVNVNYVIAELTVKAISSATRTLSSSS